MKNIAVLIVAACMLCSCAGKTGKKGEAAAKLAVAGNNREATGKTENTSGDKRNSPQAVGQYTYRVVKTLPHDTKAYTQGLFWIDGYMYESTGQYGASEIRRTDPSTGKVLQRAKLDKRYFGEGAAALNGKIYQLTWQEGKAFVYDLSTLRPAGSFSYDNEGWGLTTDGEKLYMSDGTNLISVRDPETFSVEREIYVKDGRNRVWYINELEWIDGQIWANIYGSEYIVIIDPATGRVTGQIDFSGIQSQSDKTYDTDVFNGIAYDEATGNIYVTGKLWNKIYQIEIAEKQ